MWLADQAFVVLEAASWILTGRFLKLVSFITKTRQQAKKLFTIYVHTYIVPIYCIRS